MKIRENILDLVGGDLSAFGDKDYLIEGNLAEAIFKWLEFGKDRAKFYDWMRERGYLASPKETIGYWKFVRSFENPENKVTPDDEYCSYSLSGGNGSYRSKVTVLWSNSSNYHKGDCVSEYVEAIATSSQPKAEYAGGELATLDLYIGANTSTPICGHFPSCIWAKITSVNKDRPFANYGSDLYMLDVTEKHPVEYLWNAGSVHGNYLDMKVTVGGKMPSGSKKW